MTLDEENAHVLESKWALSEQYFIDNKVDRRKGYENSFEKLCIIGSIEMFWAYWKVLPAISDVFFDGSEKIVERFNSTKAGAVGRKCRIIGQCIFKEGIEPKYEDPQNEKGGHLMCVFGRNIYEYDSYFVEEDHNNLSIFWEAVVMGLIGEELDDGDNITGARVIDKSNTSSCQISHRVEIWFRDWNNEEFKEALQERITKLMNECGCISTDVSMHLNDYSKYTK